MATPHCHSCAAPLSGEFRGVSDEYCTHCTDAQGNLRPRAEIQAGVAHWFQTWQPGVTEEQARARAEHYLRSMPAWAEG